MKPIPFFVLLIVISSILLAACQSGPGPEAAIEGYILALVDKDEDSLISLSCNAWEEGARTDARAYDGVETRLEGLECEQSSASDGEAIVSCTGTIIGTYNGEDRPIDLAARDFLAVEEGGEWRMCGYR
ncbi:MAG: hypothetical protein DWQ07_22255 [Chloroflexi bacterium]|nr:MAG: hypothetical protein DWQ07_22255 [Chloroflexota bacterium]MBL1193871.1 hypothetical protein [Chloroflexota bacterium]NOH11165.1 hypothetical protein [Chloroflexota bacterium]